LLCYTCSVEVMMLCYTCSVKVMMLCYTCSVEVMMLCYTCSVEVMMLCYTCLVEVMLLCYTCSVEVRLVGDNKPPYHNKLTHAGRLEIRYNDTWGTVCDDEFNEAAAAVACKMLGFTYVLFFNQNF